VTVSPFADLTLAEILVPLALLSNISHSSPQPERFIDSGIKIAPTDDCVQIRTLISLRNGSLLDDTTSYCFDIAQVTTII
jgi:hypothetical protein